MEEKREDFAEEKEPLSISEEVPVGETSEDEEREGEKGKFFEKFGHLWGVLYKFRRAEEGVSNEGHSFASVSLVKESPFQRLVVEPESDELEPLSIPLSKSFLLRVAASQFGGVKKSIYEKTGRETVEFLSSKRVYRFFYVNRDFPEVLYELRLLKKNYPSHRLFGKFRGICFSLENWSVVVSSRFPLAVTKRISSGNLVVELSSPFYETFLSREDVLSFLSWYSDFKLSGGVNGYFVPDPSGERRVLFGLKDGSKVKEGFVLGNTVYSDPNVFRMVAGLLYLASSPL